MMERIFSWDTAWYVLLVMYVPACLGLIVIVLLQKGKGTGFAGAFGGGGGPGSETVFGPRAGQTLPVKLTYVAAIIFVLISLSMSMIASYVGRGNAPELIGGAGTAPAAASTGLEDLGIGGGKQGAGVAMPAPEASAPITSAPVPVVSDEPAAAATTPAESPAPAETAPTQP